jgi:hypothetical protein
MNLLSEWSGNMRQTRRLLQVTLGLLTAIAVLLIVWVAR